MALAGSQASSVVKAPKITCSYSIAVTPPCQGSPGQHCTVGTHVPPRSSRPTTRGWGLSVGCWAGALGLGCECGLLGQDAWVKGVCPWAWCRAFLPSMVQGKPLCLPGFGSPTSPSVGLFLPVHSACWDRMVTGFRPLLAEGTSPVRTPLTALRIV